MKNCVLLAVAVLSSVFTLLVFHLAIQIATYDGWMLGGYSGAIGPSSWWYCMRLPLGGEWFVSTETDETVSCVEIWKQGAPVGADSLFGTVCLDRREPSLWRSY